MKSAYEWYLLRDNGDLYQTSIPDPDPVEIPALTLAFNSTAVKTGVHKLYIEGSRLYLLHTDGTMESTTDGSSWTSGGPTAWPGSETVSDLKGFAFQASGSSIGSVLASFDDDSLYEYTGSSWVNRSKSLVPEVLRAVEAKSGSTWAAGDDGELYERLSGKWLYRPHSTASISVKALTQNNTELIIASGSKLYTYGSNALTEVAGFMGNVNVLESDGTRAVGLSNSGNVYEKTSSWTALQTLSPSIYAVSLHADGDLIAASAGQVYERNTTFALTETPRVLPLKAIASGSVNDAVAVGEQGTVITSSDGGQSWRPRYSGTGEDLISVTASGTRAMAGAANGDILYSSNSGASWSNSTVTNTEPVTGIKTADGQNVLAVAGNKLFKSTNYGATFSTEQTFAVNATGVWLDAEGYGFIVGEAGLAYRITPSFTYTAVTTDDNLNDDKGTGLPAVDFSSVYFQDRLTGYITGEDGLVLKTTDGGKRWHTLESGGSDDPILAFNNQEYGNLVNGYGQLSRIRDRSEQIGSRFWYDQLGRLTLSQNSKQYNIENYLTTAEKQQVPGAGTIYAYSYTKYDHIGRIVEVGELLTRQILPTFKHETQVDYTVLNTNFITPAVKREITKTYYDRAAFTNVYPYFAQENLRPRVASTTYQDKEGLIYDRATHYSYDIHGNVKSLVQEIKVDGVALSKKIDYDYDLVSGKVNYVYYQKGKEDQFIHRYSYDGDNRITTVQTSKDGTIWDTDAKYHYYGHGPLARLELGEHHVDTLDYAYTLQGWIKGVDATNWKYSIGYNSDDYKSIGNSNGLLSTPVANDLYNGNIATMATEIPFFGTQPGENSRFDQQFTYDQLNRITSSKKVSGAGYETSYLYDPSGNIMGLTRKDASGNSLDQLTYHYENKEKGYKYNTNKLRWVDDETETEERGDDLEDQGIDNYDYDDIGNLKKDEQEEIQDIQWTVYGKVQRVTRTPNSNKPDLEFSYDASGNRVSKKVINKNGTVTTTFYIRDASGNTMAVYEKESAGSLPLLSEQHLYGSQRLGILRPTAASLQGGKHFVGLKELELSDHLGNVSVTLSDYKFSGVRSAVNYYVFGMASRSYQFNEQRYGFNGQERDDEFSGDYAFEARFYDPRIARLLSIDPLSKDYPWYTPYQFAGNTPIQARDLLGEQPDYVVRKWTHSQNYGGLYPGHEEYGAVLSHVEANTINVSALLKNKDVHGGTLEVMYTPQGKLVSAKWTGYKEKSFIDKHFTASSNADAGWEGEKGLKEKGIPTMTATAITIVTLPVSAYYYGAGATGTVLTLGTASLRYRALNSFASASSSFLGQALANKGNLRKIDYFDVGAGAVGGFIGGPGGEMFKNTISATTDYKLTDSWSSIFVGTKSNADYAADLTFNAFFSTQRLGLKSLSQNGSSMNFNFVNYTGGVLVGATKSTFSSKFKKPSIGVSVTH